MLGPARRSISSIGGDRNPSRRRVRVEIGEGLERVGFKLNFGDDGPFGLLDVHGEDFLLAAQRELAEEVGLAGQALVELGAHHLVEAGAVGEDLEQFADRGGEGLELVLGEAFAVEELRTGLEGIISKRRDSVYRPGSRTREWVKVKIRRRQEFVVGGWTPEKDSSTRGGLGALQIGYYDCNKPQRLHYAGGVGSGFTAETHRQMLKLLEARRTGKNPFVEKLPKRNVTFVKPDLVVEVEYRRWPAGGMVQQAAFKGVRTDKPAREVVREDRACR